MDGWSANPDVGFERDERLIAVFFYRCRGTNKLLGIQLTFHCLAKFLHKLLQLIIRDGGIGIIQVKGQRLFTGLFTLFSNP